MAWHIFEYRKTKKACHKKYPNSLEIRAIMNLTMRRKLAKTYMFKKYAFKSQQKLAESPHFLNGLQILHFCWHENTQDWPFIMLVQHNKCIIKIFKPWIYRAQHKCLNSPGTNRQVKTFSLTTQPAFCNSVTNHAFLTGTKINALFRVWHKFCVCIY